MTVIKTEHTRQKEQTLRIFKRVESFGLFLLRSFVGITMFLTFSGFLKVMESKIVAKDGILNQDDSPFATAELARGFCLSWGKFYAKGNF